MDDILFISYARADGAEFATKLYDALVENQLAPWLDEKNIAPGADWDDEIDKGLQSAAAVLLVLTPASVLSHQVKSEWNSALTRFVPVLPLLVKDCEIPRVIAVFNYIDFRSNYEDSLRQLLAKLDSLNTDHVNYLQKTLQAYLTAQKESENPERFIPKIHTIEERIASYGDAQESQKTRIAAGIDKERERLREQSLSGKQRSQVVVVGQKPTEPTELFKDRVFERGLIRDSLVEKKHRLITVIGRGGMGKTELVTKVLIDLTAAIEARQSDYIVRGIVYLSARANEITLEKIFLNCAKMLPNQLQNDMQRVWSDTKLSTREKVDQLVDALNQDQYIIYLDNFETILDVNGKINDKDVESFIVTFLTRSTSNTILVTTRYHVQLDPKIAAFEKQILVQDGLPQNDAVKLLQELDPNTQYGIRNAPPSELETLVELSHGMPRALEIMVAILASDPFMDISSLRNEFIYHEDTVTELIQENYRKLDESSQRILESLATYKRPVSLLAIDFLLEPFFPGLNTPALIRDLANTHIVDINRNTKTLYLHPIDSDYSYSQIPDCPADTEEASYCKTNVELRAAEFYRKFHSPPPWRTLDDVQTYIDEFDHTIRANQSEKALRILATIANFLAFQGHVFRLKKMAEQAVDENSANFHYAIGLSYVVLGPIQQALEHLNKALSLSEGNPHKKDILIHLGNAHRKNGEADKAIAHLDQALAFDLSAEDKLQTLLNLSLTCSNEWRLSEAIRYGNMALENAGKSDDAADRAVTLAKAHNAVAMAYSVAEKHEPALEHAQKSLDYYREFAKHGGSAINGTTYMLQLVGLAKLQQGNIAEGQRLLLEALENTKNYDLPMARGYVMFNIAVAHHMADEFKQAHEAVKVAAKLFSDIGVKHIDLTTFEKALRAHLDANFHEEGQQLLQTAEQATKSADLYSSLYFANAAMKLAKEQKIPSLETEANKFIESYNTRIIVDDLNA